MSISMPPQEEDLPSACTHPTPEAIVNAQQGKIVCYYCPACRNTVPMEDGPDTSLTSFFKPKPEPERHSEEWFRAWAAANYGNSGEVEFDEDAQVSMGNPEEGAYVQAWVWVDGTEEGMP